MNAHLFVSTKPRWMSSLSASVLMIVLSACAAGPVAKPAKVVEPIKSPEQETLPTLSLDESTLYQILASEIALQRNQSKAAYATYFSLANKLRDPRLAKRAVEIALLDQNLDRALESTQLWAALSPNNVQAQQSLGVLLVSKGALVEAEPRLAAKLAQDKLAAQSHTQEQSQVNNLAYENIFRIVQRAQDRAAAHQMLKRLFKNDMNNATALILLSASASSAGENLEAVEFAKASQKINDDAETAIALAQFQQAADGNINNAIQTLNGFLQRKGNNEDVLMTQGRLYASDRQWTAARQVFEQLLANNPKNTTLLYTLGLVSSQQPDRDAAKKYFGDYLLTREAGDGRDVSSIYLTLSQLGEEARDWTDALAWLNRVPDGANRTDVITRRAGILSKQKLFAQAQKIISSAQPKNDAERVQLTLSEVQLFRDQDQYQKALKKLESALNQLPDQPDLLYEKAMVAEKLDMLDTLETSLRKVIEIRPDSPHAYNALGFSLADRNLRLQEALELIQRAVSLAPNDPYIIDSLGWVLFRLKEYEQAEKTLRKAYSIKADQEIAVHLGELLWVQGRNAEALGLLKEAEAKEPQNAALRDTLKRLDIKL